MFVLYYLFGLPPDDDIGEPPPEVVQLAPPPVMTPQRTVTIGGVVQTNVLEFQTVSRLNEVMTATLLIPPPFGNELVKGAEVIIEATNDIDDPQERVFWGTIDSIDREFTQQGNVRRLSCHGRGWALTLPLEETIAYAGGARTTPTLISSSVYHIGNHTYAHYSDTTPDGTTVTVTFTPSVDARFVQVTGRQHGANSFPISVDKEIREFSRIEIWQAGAKRGYANMPESAEQYEAKLDYTDDANWEDFDLTIGASIDKDLGDVEIRFISGRKPGSSERDDYEIKGVTYRIAGRSGVQGLLKSLMRTRGYGTNGNGVPYRIPVVRDLNGDEVLLGGNGLIDNGQVVLEQGEQPWRWMADLVDLWGYALIDHPRGIRVVDVKGEPIWYVNEKTFTDQLNAWSLKWRESVSDTVTKWAVYGASGSDEYGQPFQYASVGVGVDAPSYIPDPPGFVARELSTDLLVSDGLAQSVREVAELQSASSSITVTFSGEPSPHLTAGSAIALRAPTLGIDETISAWATEVRHSWTAAGFWTTITARKADGVITAEESPEVDALQDVPFTTRHIGVETISWYRVPSPAGTSVTFDFHPGGDFRAVQVTGRFHGANSWKSGSPAGTNTKSRIQVWQYGVMLGEEPLPVGAERYTSRRDYNDDAFWMNYRVVISCDIANGPASLVFVSGTARDASRDDFEIKETVVKLYAEATERNPITRSGADWHAYQPRRVWRWAG